MHYIREYNDAPRAVKWCGFDPNRRITSTSAVTGHQEHAAALCVTHADELAGLGAPSGHLRYGPSATVFRGATSQ